MYKVYFKQAIELLKQNKFISTISIAGTALAIMMVMVLIVVDQIKNADIAPENTRSELLYVNYKKLKGKKFSQMSSGMLSIKEVNLIKDNVKSASKISANDGRTMDFWGRTLQTKNSKMRYSVDVRSVDATYWDIFSFSFIEGKPFDQADFDSGLKKVILCESLSKQLFGKGSALGQKLIIETDEYTIVGVVKDISKAFTNTYAQAWRPYTSMHNFNGDVIFLADKSKIADIEKEIRTIEEKYNLTDENYSLELLGPYNHRESQILVWDFDKNKKIESRRMIFLFSILLLIPAINLSGLSLSRIRRRMEEIGIRKAFGAKRKVIVIQVLYENFITSLIGGFLGLFLSFLIVSFMKGWLLKATDTTAIPTEALISIPILIAVVVISFILNLLSAGIPAWRAANMNIVDSLNRKK